MKEKVNYNREDLSADLCKSAYYWRSFDPDKAGEKERDAYVSQMDEFVVVAEKLAITEEQKGKAVTTLLWIKTKLLELTRAYLSAGSRCASVAITGRGNFNYKRNDKANNAYDNRINEYLQFVEKAKKILAENINKLEPKETTINKELQKAKRYIAEIVGYILASKQPGFYYSLALLKNNGKNRIFTICKNNPEVIDDIVAELKKQEANNNITIFTKNNKIWAELEALKVKKEQPKETTEEEINGVNFVQNQEADRLQLFFNGKPSDSIRTQLKKKGFHWSPFFGCWQRKLTQQAIFDAKNIVGGE